MNAGRTVTVQTVDAGPLTVMSVDLGGFWVAHDATELDRLAGALIAHGFRMRSLARRLTRLREVEA